MTLTTNPNSAYDYDEAMELHAEICGREFRPWAKATDWFVCDNEDHQHVYWVRGDQFFCRPAMAGHS